MAKSKKNKKEQANKATKKRMFGLIVFCLLCVVFLQLTFLFIIIGMLPAIVAYFVQRDPRQGIFHSVFACNLSGAAVVIVPLLAQGNSPMDLHMFMSDATNWLIMYISAAFGWILVYGAPYVGQFMIDAIQSKTLSRLYGNNKKLEEEWGDDLRFNEAIAGAKKRRSANASEGIA